MAHHSKLTQVHHVLKKTLEDLKLDDSFVVKPIWEQWAQVVGPDIARRTEPLYVRGRTLIVACEHSTWMNELTHQKQALLKKVNELPLAKPIDEIRFRMKE